MGKPAKQPRVKGNMKPASSSRAADLASGTGNPLSIENLGGFAQFAASTVAPSPGVTSKADNPSDAFSLATNLDPEVNVIIKKISKRDAVTKLRALDELETYLKAHMDAISAVVPIWSKLYVKLTIEVDRRVRVAANSVHGFISMNGKKKMAPYLKEFIGAWMITMFDQSKEVATVARSSFETVFAEGKRLGVLTFCQKEILDYVSEILLEKSPETLSDPRYTAKEDMLAKYARVVAGSFDCINSLIQKLPLEDRQSLSAEYDKLLDSPVIWKMLADKNPTIRQAVYRFLRTLLLYWTDSLNHRLDTICPTFFAAVFAEKEMRTFSDMWDAFLLLTKNFPESWIVAGKKKPMLPKLYSFLRSGLNGAIDVGYPTLVVLLANIPQELRAQESFFTDAFESFWKGHLMDSFDRTKLHIFMSAYVECITYFAIQQSALAENDQNKNVHYLIDNVFQAALRSYLMNDENLDEKSTIRIAKIFANHMITITTAQNIKDHLTTFWSSMDHMLIQPVIDCNVERKKQFDVAVFCHRVACFFEALWDAMASSKAQNTTVLKEHVNSWAVRLTVSALESSMVHKEHAQGLLHMVCGILTNGPDTLFQATVDAETVGNKAKMVLTFVKDMPSCVAPVVEFYTGLLKRLPEGDLAKGLWTSALVTIQGFEPSIQIRVLIAFLSQTSRLTAVLHHNHMILEELIRKLVIDELENSNKKSPDLEQLIVLCMKLYLSHLVLPRETFEKIGVILQKYLAALTQCQYTGLTEKGVAEAVPKAQFALKVLQQVLVTKEHAKSMIGYTAVHAISVCVFDIVFLKTGAAYEPSSDSASKLSDCIEASSRVWDLLVTAIHEAEVEQQKPILELLATHTKNSITDIACIASPLDSVRRVEKLISSFHSQPAFDMYPISYFFGNPQEWSHLEGGFTQHTVDYLSLAIVDKYAGLVNMNFVESDELPPVFYDAYGLSSYGRFILFASEYTVTNGVNALLDAKLDWVLQQLMMVSFECQSGLQLPGACRIWDDKMAACTAIIRGFVLHVDNIFSSWMDSVIGQAKDWSKHLFQSVQGSSDSDKNNRFFTFMTNLLKSPRITLNHTISTRVTPMDTAAAKLLEKIFERLLTKTEWDVSDLQRWLTLTKAESKELGLHAKVALISVLKNAIGETQPFRNLQSDLASKISGINSYLVLEDNNPKAWKLLVLLNATTLKFGEIAIPPQRLMHTILTIRKWFEESAEDDLETDQRIRLFIEVAKFFANVSESVESISGGQWDLFLQRSYEWISFSDPTVAEELPLVYYGLNLYAVLDKLSMNGEESICESVKEYSKDFYNTLLDLLAQEHSLTKPPPKPRLQYDELLCSLCEKIPGKTSNGLIRVPEMIKLLDTPVESLQKCAYSLLQKYIWNTAQELSVRMEFSHTDSSEEKTDHTEKELWPRLLQAPDISQWHSAALEEQPLHKVFGYLLSWLLLFENFNDTTFRVKQHYIAQLKDIDAVSVVFPFLSNLLSIGISQTIQPFDLLLWDVSAYEVEGFDSAVEVSYLLLASHLYYKCLKHIPSLVRRWWIDCKNRQLTIAIESFVEKNFSALLISNELELINRPDIKTELETNENEFTVKTLKSANEVAATYLVDEQSMHIAIKLPNNYPLRQIDIEGVQKVGVSDRQWRGWMFAVQAVIGSQNGNIVDALTVFKRNANLHFDGVEDCTICYSIISPQDRSIPTKQCRTCKNKFHPSCLYKWFRSSNSASCPLCRTVF